LPGRNSYRRGHEQLYDQAQKIACGGEGKKPSSKNNSGGGKEIGGLLIFKKEGEGGFLNREGEQEN